MADYYPLLAKAIAGLPDSTAEARQAVYERARKALFGQLRNLDPPVPEDVIHREAQALERAVAQLETELTARSGPETGTAAAEPDFTRLGKPVPSGPEPRGFVPPPQTERPSPPLRIRREPPPPNPAAPAYQAPAAQPAPAPPLARDNPASRAARFESQGRVPPPGEGLFTARPEASPPAEPFLSGSSYDDFTPEQPSQNSGSYDREDLRVRTVHPPYEPRPGGDAGTVRRVGIVIAVIGLIVALVAVAAYKLRDRPEDLVRLPSPAPAAPGDSGAKGKIIDRIEAGSAAGSGPATAAGRDETKPPPIPVARRAALLVEAPEEPSKVKTFPGTVVWRVENVSTGPDEPLRMAVRADADIAEAGLQAAMILQKNFDSTLPASHTMKLRFSTQPNSLAANIKQISVVQMRREETPTGDALKGITVPVTDNAFLIGLSRGNDEAFNLDLLRSREWFDIPMVLADGRIAKLTFEKGPAGRSALEDAMASWQAQK